MSPLTTSSQDTTTASAVVVVESAAPSIASLQRLSALLAERFTSSEIVLVANDAPEEIAESLAPLAQQVPDLTVHFLMGRVDFHSARLVGIDNALGDWVLLTSASPEELEIVPALLDRRGQTDVIIVDSGAPPHRRGMYSLAERGFLRLCAELTQIRVEPSDSPLRLLNRAACLRIVNDPYGELLIRASRIGSGIRVMRLKGRYAPRIGRRQYHLAEGLQQGLGTLVRSSVVPLRIVSMFSLSVAAFAFVYTAYILTVYLLKQDVAPGWTTLSLQISVLMLSTATMLWLIAEYILVVRAALPPRRRISIAREVRSPQTRGGSQLNVVNEEGRMFAVGSGDRRAASRPRTGRNALIGYSGFVGSNLDRPERFTERFNSKNFESMAGDFDLVVCAGVSAAKWIANRDPEADWQAIEKLLAVLDRVKAREFVLISTIDVYPDPAAGGDESVRIDGATNHAYGRNRLRLEEWVTARFPAARIIRLPALYGPGLKKNALYDLLHDNQVAQINPAGSFQWYPVARLWDDLGRLQATDLRLVNLVTEPLGMAEIIERWFPGTNVGPPREPAPRYRMETRHAAIFGGEGSFVMANRAVLEDIGRFVTMERATRQ